MLAITESTGARDSLTPFGTFGLWATRASTHLLSWGPIPASIPRDLPQRLANEDPWIADDAARADHARHFLVARDGGRASHAAHLGLRLDAHGGRDAANCAADAAERRCALLAAELRLEAAQGFARHAPHAPIAAKAAVVRAAARVNDHDRIVVERVAVAVAAHRSEQPLGSFLSSAQYLEAIRLEQKQLQTMMTTTGCLMLMMPFP